jgi:hypothetical protein
MRLRPPLFQSFFALSLLILGGQQTTAQPAAAASKAIPALVPQTSKLRHDTPGETDGMPRLPDFYAKRISVRYEENPEYKEGTSRVEPEPIHEVEHSRATVLYRNGSEILEAKAKQSEEQNRYLITYGTFGPLLRAVMDPIVAPGGLTWSRWEKIEGGGRRGVFRYEVSAQRSRYQSGGVVFPTVTER